MNRPSRLTSVLIGGVLAFLLVALGGGCDEAGSTGEEGAVRLTPPSGWFAVDPSRLVLPGRCLGAWSGPGDSSLAVVEALPVPRGDASGLLKELANRYENLPDLRIVASKTRPVGGVQAAWFEVVAPGTGEALAPTGLGKPVAPKGRKLVPTHRVLIGLPLKALTTWIIWTYPESDAEARAPDVEAVAGSVRVTDRPASSSSY